MKTKLLFCIFLFSSYFISGQNNIVLYALESNFSAPTQSNPNGDIESMDFIRINPLSGIKTELFEIDNSYAVASGSSSYNATQDQFFYFGLNDVGTSYIYTLDINNNNTITTSTNGLSYIEIEYNYSDGKIYAIRNNNGMTELVEVDFNTGIATLVSDLSYIEGVAIGNSTFDPINNLYIFRGVDGNSDRLVGVDVTTGEVIYNSELNLTNGQIGFFEFDWTNQRLLGLRQTITPQGFIDDNFMVEVDLATGIATELFSNPVFSNIGIVIGGVAFDQQSQTYITYVNQNFDLGMINTNTGELFNTIPTDQIYYELQVDNFNYAEGLSIPISTSNKTPLVEEFLVFPNPISNELVIDLENNFQKGSLLEVFDFTGKRILTNSINFSQLRINTYSWGKGIYFIKIKNSDKILTSKVIKL